LPGRDQRVQQGQQGQQVIGHCVSGVKSEDENAWHQDTIGINREESVFAENDYDVELITEPEDFTEVIKT